MNQRAHNKKRHFQTTPLTRVAKTHLITLVWQDQGRCSASVSSLAPEITCGKHRFRQDAQDGTVYNEV